MTPSPDPQSNRKQLTVDELIAVFVALTSIGAILFWSFSQKDGGMNLSFLQMPLESASPTAAPSPLVASPTPAAATTMPPIAATVDKTASSTVPAPIAPSASPAPLTALQAAPLIALVPKVLSPQPSPSAAAPPTGQAKSFTDVPSGYWASVPIAALSAQGILDGFPDGTFQPNKPVTRAEFAEMIRRAFKQPTSRAALKFNDLPPNYWAIGAIDEATQTRFMSGFPDGSFQPNRQIPRVQALLALATGLNLPAKSPSQQVLSRYQDAAQIPKYATGKIAAATEAGLVLNDVDPNRLNPDQITTRAEAAALVYEALKK